MYGNYTYLLIGVALLAVVAWWMMKKPSSDCDAPEPKKMVLFFSEKCPASVHIKPTREELKKNHYGEASIVFMEIDADKNPDPRITSLPTIILESNGEQFMFKDSRTMEKLETFIQKN